MPSAHFGIRVQSATIVPIEQAELSFVAEDVVELSLFARQLLLALTHGNNEG